MDTPNLNALMLHARRSENGQHYGPSANETTFGSLAIHHVMEEVMLPMSSFRISNFPPNSEPNNLSNAVEAHGPFLLGETHRSFALALSAGGSGPHCVNRLTDSNLGSEKTILRQKLVGLLTALGLAITMVLVAPPSAKAGTVTFKELEGDGRTISAPAVASGVRFAKGVFKTFVRGRDDRIYEHVYGVWSPVPGDALTLAAPSAVLHNDIVKVFIRGTNNGIWKNEFDGFTWSGWSEIFGGGRTLDGPAAIVHNGILKVFVKGLNLGIWENDFNGDTWSGWSEIRGGGRTMSTPAPVVHSSILKLFIRDTSNNVRENQFSGTTWSGFWSAIPGATKTLDGPSALVHNGILKLHITGLDHAVWKNDFNGGTWLGWSRISNVSLTPSAPAAVEAYSLYPVLFLRSEDGRILSGNE